MLFELKTGRSEVIKDLTQEVKVSFNQIRRKQVSISQTKFTPNPHESDLGRSTEAMLRFQLKTGNRFGQLGQYALAEIMTKKLTLSGVDEQLGIRLTAIPDIVTRSQDHSEVRLVEIKDRYRPFPSDVMQAEWAIGTALLDDRNRPIQGKIINGAVYYAQSDKLIEIPTGRVEAMWPIVRGLIGIWRILLEPKTLRSEARKNYKERFVNLFADWKNQCAYVIEEQRSSE